VNGRILIVDDEESIRFTFHSFLSKEGHEVFTAPDFESALKTIGRNNLDVIFADIVLGGRTGIDLLKEAKTQNLRCPVIMITGQPTLDTATESVRLGAFDYLVKPVRKDAILHSTRLALRHKRLADEKEQIEAEKDRFRSNLEAIFRSVKDAIITVDNEMRVIEANPATGDICALLPREITGKKLAEVTSCMCSKSCVSVLKEALAHRRTIREYRTECRHPNRPKQVVILTVSPLRDRHEGFGGAVLVIRDVTRLSDLEEELRERYQFHNIVGKSQEMQDIYRLISDLAEVETTVLVTGESGTGKDLVAKALHHMGERSSRPLVVVNCSALAENLLESELFGHVRGAFTGAIKDRTGRFHVADGGTMILDEVGDISPKIQLKLLRVLEEKELERVGESVPVKVDVRVIATTNRDLRERVRQGEFREDLYYRLKVMEISLPPLRDRRGDIPLLVEHFRKRFNTRFKREIEGLSEEALKRFMAYSWPGNIRQLEHVMEHAFVLCRDRIISTTHLPPELEEPKESGESVREKTPQETRQEILDVLSKTGWNKAKAARLLSMSRQTLYRKLERHDLSHPSEKV
jgi:two-component system, NtrC family, response regulator HydG